jgi:hypothetical protein
MRYRAVLQVYDAALPTERTLTILECIDGSFCFCRMLHTRLRCKFPNSDELHMLAKPFEVCTMVDVNKLVGSFSRFAINIKPLNS